MSKTLICTALESKLARKKAGITNRRNHIAALKEEASDLEERFFIVDREITRRRQFIAKKRNELRLAEMNAATIERALSAALEAEAL